MNPCPSRTGPPFASCGRVPRTGVYRPLSRAVLRLSKQHKLCICAGIAELSHNIVYNSQIVADRGQYLGLQRKINLSGDEYCYFRAGEKVPVFDIGDLRFGISIC